MLNVAKITSTLSKLPDAQLQQYAQMHKSDPYTVALAVAESNRRRELRQEASAVQAQPGRPKVVDAAIADMATPPLPESVGIGTLPAGDMNFADGGVVGYASGGAAEARKAKFIAEYGGLAQRVGQELGVDPRIIIAQWGLETRWGEAQIGAHNLGNIKDSTKQGPRAFDKTEKSNDSYRTYDSPDAFGDDYAKRIRTNFAGAVGAGDDPRKFAEGLARGKYGRYATDPKYDTKLADTVAGLPALAAGTADQKEPKEIYAGYNDPVGVGRRVLAQAKDFLSLPGRGVAGAFESAVTRPLNAVGIPLPYLPRSFYGGDAAAISPYMDAIRKEDAQRAQRPVPADEPLERMYIPPTEAKSPSQGAATPEAVTGTTSPEEAPLIDPRLRSLMDAARERQAQRHDRANAQFQSDLPVGTAYEEDLQRVMQREAEHGKKIDRNQALAIMEAGLGMLASKSPYMGVGIGEGALRGVGAYKTGLEALDRAQGDRDKTRMTIAGAQRNEKFKIADVRRAMATAQDREVGDLDTAEINAAGRRTGSRSGLMDDFLEYLKLPPEHQRRYEEFAGARGAEGRRLTALQARLTNLRASMKDVMVASDPKKRAETEREIAAIEQEMRQLVGIENGGSTVVSGGIPSSVTAPGADRGISIISRQK